MTVSGLIQLDGRPLASQRVLAISGDPGNLLGSAETGDDGRFSIEASEPSSGARVSLLAKVQGPVVAIAHRIVYGAGPHEFSFDTRGGEFHAVRGTIETASGSPPYLNVFVNPVHVDGVPAEFEPFFERRDERVVESTFFKQRVDERVFELTLMAGTYRIGGSHIDRSRPMMIRPDFENYVVAQIEADGEDTPLPGNTASGYLLEVTRDRELRLMLELLPDEALSPEAS